MFTILLSLGKVHGASAWLAFWVGGANVYFWPGRGLPWKTRLLRLNLCSLLVDVVWFLYFYPGGAYQNPGLKGVFVLLLWPTALAVLRVAEAIMKK